MQGWKNWLITLFVLLLLALIGGGVHAQPLRSGYVLGTTPAKPVAIKTPVLIAPDCELVYSASLLYVRERTGHNDAPEIDKWADATGTRRKSSWCGLYQWAVNKHCGRPVPAGPAGSYNWFKDAKRTYYVRGQKGDAASLKPKDKVGFYYANLGRVGHIGLIVEASRSTRKGRPARGYTIRAGNTGSYGGRDGAGVHDYFYSATDIYAASRW